MYNMPTKKMCHFQKGHRLHLQSSNQYQILQRFPLNSFFLPLSPFDHFGIYMTFYASRLSFFLIVILVIT